MKKLGYALVLGSLLMLSLHGAVRAVDIGTISLTNGDVVESNEVDWDDYNALVDAFGSLPGDANWNLNADLDGTGEVDWDDFNIVVNSFGAVGD